MAWNENKEPRLEEPKVMSHPGGESTSASSCCCSNMDAGQWWPSLEDGSRGAKHWRTGHPSRLSGGCDINTLRWLTLRLIHLLILLPGKIFWGTGRWRPRKVTVWVGVEDREISLLYYVTLLPSFSQCWGLIKRVRRLRAGQKGPKCGQNEEPFLLYVCMWGHGEM